MILSPSLMCANPLKLGEEVLQLRNAGADSFHVDIMDGVFVPNFALSWPEVKAVKKECEIPLEIHLMVSDLKPHIPFIKESGPRKLFVHGNIFALLELSNLLESEACCVAPVVNWRTSESEMQELIEHFHSFLFMRVEPGFAGQKPSHLADSILLDFCQKFEDCTFTVDGGVSLELIAQFKKFQNIEYVLGTASIFNKDRSYKDIIEEIRKC